jgi:isoleucyl-tRNA synthetase
VRLQAKDGWTAAQGKQCVVVLATELTPELVAEGLARELVRTIQDRRKDMNLEYTDRICVGLVTKSAELTAAAGEFSDYICGETLATELQAGPLTGTEPIQVKVAGELIELYVEKNHGG